MMQRSIQAYKLEAALRMGARYFTAQQAAVHCVDSSSEFAKKAHALKSVAFFVVVGPKMQRTKWVNRQQKGSNQRQRREVQRPLK